MRNTSRPQCLGWQDTFQTSACLWSERGRGREDGVRVYVQYPWCPKNLFLFFSFSYKCRNKIHFSLPFQVGSNAGIVGMTKEHLGLALALNVPVFVVVTKIDMCPANILQGKPSGVLFALQYFLIMQKVHQTLSWLLLAYMLFVCIFTC